MDLQKQRRKKRKRNILSWTTQSNKTNEAVHQIRVPECSRMREWVAQNDCRSNIPSSFSFPSHLISSKRWVRGGKEIQRSDRGDSCRWWSIIGSIQVDPFCIFYMPNPGVRSLFRRWHLCSIPPIQKKRRKIMERIRLSYWLITISIISSIKLFFFWRRSSRNVFDCGQRIRSLWWSEMEYYHSPFSLFIQVVERFKCFENFMEK